MGDRDHRDHSQHPPRSPEEERPRSVPRPAAGQPPTPEPPRVVSPGDEASPVAPGHASAPEPAPLPDFTVPAHEPFRYESNAPLTPAELDLISLFHSQFMQGAGIGSDRQKFAQAQRDAAIVLPLMQKQYTLACQGVGKETSQEAQQVKRNVEWVEQLLAMHG
jgi:hypothetical protein